MSQISKQSLEIQDKIQYWYDPYQIPADWHLAQNHQLAKKFAKPLQFNHIDYQHIHSQTALQNQMTACPCCLKYINKQNFKYCEDINQLGKIGQGYPLFYNLMKFCILLLFLTIFSNSIINIMYNLNQGVCQSTQCSKFSIVIEFSFVKNETAKLQRRIINYCTFVLLLIFLLNFRLQQNSLSQFLAERLTTLSDYSVIIENIPNSINNQILLRQFIRGINKYSNLQVKQVLLFQNLKDYFKLDQQLKEIISQKSNQIATENRPQILEAIEQVQEQIKLKINQLEVDMNKNNHKYFINKAIITLNTQYQRNKVIKFINQQCTQQYFQSIYENKSQSYNMKANIAPQPTEIIWQNISYNQRQTLFWSIIGWILTIVVLVVFTLIVWLLHIFNQQVIRQQIGYNFKDPYAIALIIELLIVLFVNIVNKYGLTYIFDKICKLQRHKQTESYQFSFSIKYILGMFFSISLMSVIVQNTLHNNYVGSQGVIQQQSIMFLFNAFFSPILFLINPSLIIKKIKQRYYKNNIYMTQEEANKLMQNPQYDIGKRYSQIIKTMWFTYFYLSLIPIGPILSFVGIICYYLVDKYVLISNSSIQNGVSKNLSNLTVKLLQLVLILNPIGTMLFDYKLKRNQPYDSIILLIIGFIYVILPWQSIFNYFWDKDLHLQVLSYDEFKVNYLQNYETLYPVGRMKKSKIQKFLNKKSEKILIKSQNVSQTNITTARVIKIQIQRS